ncbi:MAG: hypothetical protein JWL90_2918 [Chthoniobacteraceae bacterium]|nr:hypothetical protein [Chthoniobacteraceae bacterium]
MKQNKSRGISVTELANAWGCSRSNVSRYIAKGMPMTSQRDADAWRLANASRGIGYRTKKEPEFRAEIIDSENEDKTMAELAAERHGETKNPNAEPHRKWDQPRAIRKPAKSLRSLDASLSASIQVEGEALRLVQEAQLRKDDQCLPLRIAAYNKAKEGRMQSKRLVRAFELESRTLITWEDAVEMASRFVVPLITRLRSIARRAAGMIHPADPA